jgi:hypothetical protein
LILADFGWMSRFAKSWAREAMRTVLEGKRCRWVCGSDTMRLGSSGVSSGGVGYLLIS